MTRRLMILLSVGIAWRQLTCSQPKQSAQETRASRGSALGPGTERSYFVDTSGSDSNDGRSCNTPFKTIAKVNGLRLQPGDSVMFRRGGVWRESLVTASAGAPGLPIVFGAYGIGPPPVLTGADLVTGWSAENVSISSPSGAVTAETFTAYYTSQVRKFSQVFDNDQRMQRVQSKSQLVPLSWWFDAGDVRIYLRTAGDADPGGDMIEGSARDYPVYLTQHDVVLQDLDISMGKLYGVKSSPSARLDSLLLTRCIVRDAFADNIRFDDRTAFVGPTISDSDVYGAGAVGILIEYANTGAVIRNNRVWANSQLSNKTLGGVSEQTYSAGIKVFGGSTANYQAGLIIEFNTVYGNGPLPWVPSDSLDGARSVGIWLDTVKIDTGAPVIVRQNLVHDNRSSGIEVEVSRKCQVYYNVLYSNASISGRGDLHVESQSGLSVSNIAVHHNTAYGTGYAKIVLVDGGAGFGNVLVFDNIFAQTVGGNRFGEYRIPLSGSGNLIGKNCYSTGAPFLVSANGGRRYSSLVAWIASGAQDRDSVNVDPAFLNVSGGDFRRAVGSRCAAAGVPDSVQVGSQ
jgi:hypothetical protein